MKLKGSMSLLSIWVIFGVSIFDINHYIYCYNQIGDLLYRRDHEKDLHDNAL